MSGDAIIFHDMTIPLGAPPGGDKIGAGTIVCSTDGQWIISANEEGIPIYWEASQ